jgi:hypothetical protein
VWFGRWKEAVEVSRLHKQAVRNVTVTNSHSIQWMLTQQIPTDHITIAIFHTRHMAHMTKCCANRLRVGSGHSRHSLHRLVLHWSIQCGRTKLHPDRTIQILRCLCHSAIQYFGSSQSCHESAGSSAPSGCVDKGRQWRLTLFSDLQTRSIHEQRPPG